MVSPEPLFVFQDVGGSLHLPNAPGMTDEA